MDLSDDDNVDNNETRPKSISVLSSVQEEERERTLSDLYNRVDVNLMDDFQVAMDNITRNVRTILATFLIFKYAARLLARQDCHRKQL